MKSWTSIPFYLWKNTFSRWFEYPVSPFSKILIPALLGFLAVIVLALFAEIERELRQQLAENSVFTVYTSEFVPQENAAMILRKSYEEEVMWAGRYGADVFKQVRQPLASATVNFTQIVPVIAFTSSLGDFNDGQSHEDPPTVWLLSGDRASEGEIVEISLAGKRTVAAVREAPSWLNREISMQHAVALPISMIEPYLLNGFINHTIAELDSIESVEKYVRETSSYHRAEQRNLKIVSALEILRNLEQINTIQTVVRSLIVVSCGMILALTLGSIAWLEYRQEAYILALLKSFGTPPAVLLVHMFMENLLLVLGGMLFVRLSWGYFYGMAAPKLQAIGLQSTELPPIAAADMGIILLAGFVGVFFAMLPVAFGLKKPAGLILQ